VGEVLTLIERAAGLGASASLILALYGGFKGWWVFGPTHRAKVEECDRERDRAERAEAKYVEALEQERSMARDKDQTLELLTRVVQNRE
jgi:hypothetical protein